jgi:hypothetical protein
MCSAAAWAQQGAETVVGQPRHERRAMAEPGQADRHVERAAAGLGLVAAGA